MKKEDKTNYLNEYGLLEFNHISNGNKLRRAYYWKDRALILDSNNRILEDLKFSDVDLTNWIIIKPK